jgi:hypothetical protein
MEQMDFDKLPACEKSGAVSVVKLLRNQPFNCIFVRGEYVNVQTPVFGAECEERCLIESFVWTKHSQPVRNLLWNSAHGLIFLPVKKL